MDTIESSVCFDKKALLIINPVSGKKMVLRHIPYIVRRLMDSGYLVTTCITSRRGEATELAASLGKDYDLVCCTGGDGTLNETITGIARADIHVPIGYIPCGSTNDFAMSHGLSTEITRAADNIAGGNRNQYDIGHFDKAYFTYVAAFGAFSWLSYTTDQNMKNMLGHTAYIIDGIKDVTKIRPVHIRINASGKIYEDDYIFGALCNSTSIAGTIELPKAVVDTSDGIFEVLLIKMPKTIAELDGIIRSLYNKDFSNPKIDFFQARELKIDNEPGMEWSLDGECIVPADSFEFNIMPKFLDLQG
jgi:YegS/Rv2252/BmrU family lipid kinase